MATATVRIRDLIEATLREIGVLAASETASTEEATDALKRLIQFRDRLSNEKLTLHTVSRSGWNISPGTGTYTIGELGNIPIHRPVYIQDVRLLDISTNPRTESSLRQLTEEAWEAIAQKDRTAPRPVAWYYDHGLSAVEGSASLTLWPTPTSANLQGFIYHWSDWSDVDVTFAPLELDSILLVPRGYEEMLMTNLALMLCPTYGRDPHPMLMKAAAESMAAIKRANKRLQDMSFAPDALIQGGTGRYNILEG
jgi:hypothetical protein